jgi:hypothetical protein
LPKITSDCGSSKGEAIGICVPWKDLRCDYEDWIDQMQGEHALYAFLAKNPKKVAKGARLAGLQVYIPGGGYADLVFLDDTKCYVVEVKDGVANLKKAKEEAAGYADAFREHQKDAKIKKYEVIPVGAVITYEQSRTGYVYRGKDAQTSGTSELRAS